MPKLTIRPTPEGIKKLDELRLYLQAVQDVKQELSRGFDKYFYFELVQDKPKIFNRVFQFLH